MANWPGWNTSGLKGRSARPRPMAGQQRYLGLGQHLRAAPITLVVPPQANMVNLFLLERRGCSRRPSRGRRRRELKNSTGRPSITAAVVHLLKAAAVPLFISTNGKASGPVSAARLARCARHRPAHGPRAEGPRVARAALPWSRRQSRRGRVLGVGWFRGGVRCVFPKISSKRV